MVRGELPVQELQLPRLVRMWNGEVRNSRTVIADQPQSVVDTASTISQALVVDRVGAKPTRPGMQLDRAGILWTSLCVLHCGAPLVITGAALVSGARQHAHHGHADHGGAVSLVLTSTSALVAGGLLGRSYVREHRDARPLIVFALAVALLAVGWFMRADVLLAMGATTFGLLVLVAAQVINIVVLRRRGRTCGTRPDGVHCCGSG